MAYSAKYASAFYGPFRDAVGSAGNLGKSRQEGLPDGPGQQRRSIARSGARSGRRRRHGDGQARHALPRHRAPREGRVPRADLRLSGQRRVRDAEGGGALNGWLDARRGDDGKPARLQARRRRWRADLLRARGRTAARRPLADEATTRDARLPRPGRSVHRAAGPARSDRLPTTGYLWIGIARAEFEAPDMSDVQGALQRWTGGQLVDLHVIRSAERRSCLRTSTTPRWYDLLVFRRLAAIVDTSGDAVDAHPDGAALLSAKAKFDAPAHIDTSPVGFAVFDRVLLTVHPAGLPGARVSSRRACSSRQGSGSDDAQKQHARAAEPGRSSRCAWSTSSSTATSISAAC